MDARQPVPSRKLTMTQLRYSAKEQVLQSGSFSSFCSSLSGTFQRLVGWWDMPWQRVLNHGYARERLLLFSRKIPLARSTLPENGAKRKSPESFEPTNNSELLHAADGGRTRTLSPERDFKSLVSANFTTAAQPRLTKTCCPLDQERTGNNRCEEKYDYQTVMMQSGGFQNQRLL